MGAILRRRGLLVRSVGRWCRILDEDEGREDVHASDRKSTWRCKTENHRQVAESKEPHAPGEDRQQALEVEEATLPMPPVNTRADAVGWSKENSVKTTLSKRCVLERKCAGVFWSVSAQAGPDRHSGSSCLFAQVARKAHRSSSLHKQSTIISRACKESAGFRVERARGWTKVIH